MTATKKDEINEINETETKNSLDAIKSELRERLAGDIPEGIRCSIHRLEPLWSKGYLCTIPGDESMTIESIKEQCGGGYYKLEYRTDEGQYILSRRVSIEGPPRRDGIEVLHPEILRRKVEQEAQAEKQLLARQNDGATMLQTMLATMQAQQAATVAQMQESFKSNLELIKEVMKGKEENARAAQVAQAAQAPADPVQTMTQYFKLFKDFQGAGASGDENAALGLIEKFMDTVGKQNKEQQKAPPFIGENYLNAAGVNIPANQPPPPKPNTEDIEEVDLIDHLMSLEPEETAEVMQTVFLSDPERAKKIVQFMMGSNMIDFGSMDAGGHFETDDDPKSGGQ